MRGRLLGPEQWLPVVLDPEVEKVELLDGGLLAEAQAIPIPDSAVHIVASKPGKVAKGEPQGELRADRAARRLFAYSIFYLFILFLALLAEQLLGWA